MPKLASKTAPLQARDARVAGWNKRMSVHVSSFRPLNDVIAYYLPDLAMAAAILCLAKIGINRPEHPITTHSHPSHPGSVTFFNDFYPFKYAGSRFPRFLSVLFSLTQKHYTF